MWLTGSYQSALNSPRHRLPTVSPRVGPNPRAKRSDVERPQPNLLNSVRGALDSDLLRRGRVRARMDAFHLNQLREHALSNYPVTATNERQSFLGEPRRRPPASQDANTDLVLPPRWILAAHPHELRKS